MPREAMPDVVVLLPGITGSVLHKDGAMVWGWSGRAALQALWDGGERMTEALTLRDDDPERDDIGDGVTATRVVPDLHLLPGVWKIDGYTKVAETIHANFAVEAGRNFFEFAYDWRRDNRVAARRLARQSRDWLQAWRASSGNADARLVLVAHSMGGLVSRHFLEVLGGWRDTRALLTFGTPYRGSLNALDTLANGERKAGGRIDLSPLVRSFTALYQLLPVYECYDGGDGVLRRVGQTTDIPNVDAARAAAALAFHDEIRDAVARNEQDEAYRRGRYAVFPIVGTHQPTSQSARRNGRGVAMLAALGGHDRSGDGTVPRVSATPLELSAQRREMYAATRHGSLQNADAALAQLHGALTSLYFDLGDFRGPARAGRPVQLGLDVDDVYEAEAPIELRVQTDADESVALEATVTSVESDDVVARAPLRRVADERRVAELPPLSEGAYRLRVGGAAGQPGVEPAEDTFVTLGRAAAP
jgi:hypothetical protein